MARSFPDRVHNTGSVPLRSSRAPSSAHMQLNVWSRSAGAPDAALRVYSPPSGELPGVSKPRAPVPGPANSAPRDVIALAGPPHSSSAPLPPPSWRRQTPAQAQVPECPQPLARPPSTQSILKGGSQLNSGPSDSSAAEQESDQPEQQPEHGALRRYGSYSSPAAQRALSELSGPVNSVRRAAPTSQVTFRLQYHVAYGQVLRVIGSHPNIGARTRLSCAHTCARTMSWQLSSAAQI